MDSITPKSHFPVNYATHSPSLIENGPKLKKMNQIIIQSFGAISKKTADSWKDWTDNYEKLLNQQLNKQIKQNETSTNKNKQSNRLKVKVNMHKKKQQDKTSYAKNADLLENTSDVMETNSKQRAKSQNHTQLKSLKKTNSINNAKDQEEKKAQRLKQITKRKIQLMERLKKIDAELVQTKREAEPVLDRDKSLYMSNLNKSFISQLNNSRMNKPSQNVAQQHFKVVQKLQKINNEKIKRHQKIAQQFRRKQQQEILKLQQMQKKKNMQLEQKRRKNQIAIQRMRSNKKSSKLVKISQAVGLNENQLMPTTMIKKSANNKKGNQNEKQNLVMGQKKSMKNLLTERDMDFDGEQLAKEFDQAIMQEQNEPKKDTNEQNQFKLTKQQNYAEVVGIQTNNDLNQ